MMTATNVESTASPEARGMGEEETQWFAAIIFAGSRMVVFDPETARWFEVPSEFFKLSAAARRARIQIDSCSFDSQQEARAFFALARPVEIGTLL